MPNNSTTYDLEACVKTHDDKFEKVFFVMLVICALAIILNVLTIVAIKRSTFKLNSHYLLIVQQCCVDITFSFSYFPILTFSVFWCKYVERTIIDCVRSMLMTFVNAACCLVTLNLIAIALDHFIAICNPMNYHVLVTKKRVSFVIVFMYIFLVSTIATPLFIGLSKVNSTTSTEEFCTLVPSSLVQFYHGTILFVVSILVIIPVYVYIFCKVMGCCDDNNLRRNSVAKKNVKKSTTSLLIIVTFMICFIIDISSLTAQMHIGSNVVLYYIRLISIALPSLNCIFDPLIYALRLPKVQQGYIQLWNSLRGIKNDQNIRLTSRTMSSIYSTRSSSSEKR